MTISALQISGLSVAYASQGRQLPVLEDISFSVAPGEALAIVGESGCGKSTLAASILGVLPANATVLNGSIRVRDFDTTRASFEAMRAIRGTGIAMVSQEAGGALNPSMRIGRQVMEAVIAARKVGTAEAQAIALDLVARVALQDPAAVMRRYPHQLSGGQQQRVLIAMALAGNPSVLVLDEPTTGLDATVEAEVIDLIAHLRREYSAAIIFISHNLPLVSRVCERIAILYAGRLVEIGDTGAVTSKPAHPYSAALLACLPSAEHHKILNPVAPIQGEVPPPDNRPAGCIFAPRCALCTDACTAEQPPLAEVGVNHASRCLYPEHVEASPAQKPLAAIVPEPEDGYLLEVDHLVKRYGNLVVCDDVSFSIRRGETFGLVGESGSGKSTLARCIAGLISPESGEIRLNGKPLARQTRRRALDEIRAVQMVFQSPEATLNPTFSVREALGRAVKKLTAGRREAGKVEALAQDVRFPAGLLDRRPRQLSGGQKQRVAIARAFAGSPELVLCDEPVSALDTSVQAGILYLLTRLQVEDRVSYLFISHDLGVVRYLADRVGVLYLGQLVETGPAGQIFSGPRHPYTDALLKASQREIGGEGSTPAAGGRLEPNATACRFAARCPHATSRCATEAPPWRNAGDGHQIRCHLDLETLHAASLN
ncbi:Oligopeptide transport ATP-binding protein OppF [Devosia sp. DBB001]|nr:dipeptide ABC transporter ATP-binding protein [Devosia sp. D6-9]CDP53002.1 Oligopeptide transport ATP-binding protein OppF [Devosia sp. DBB001]